MQKDGAARAFAPRPQIEIEHDHQVVETIVAPQRFMPCRRRKANEPVVGWGLRVVAPAEHSVKGKKRQLRPGSAAAQWLEKAFNQPKMSGRRSMIALTLSVRNRGGAERARQVQRTGL
jgi:hypothetical protein